LPFGQETQELEEPIDAHDEENLHDNGDVAAVVAVVHPQPATLPPRLGQLVDGQGEEGEVGNLNQEKRQIEENKSCHFFVLIKEAFPVVNFTNILQSAFAPIFTSQKVTKTNFNQRNLRKTLLLAVL